MEPIRLWGCADDPYFVRSEPSPHGEGYHEYAALPRAEYDALVAERDALREVLSHITMKMWGSEAPTHPDVKSSFDKLCDRAYSTDRAWDHIGKMCESAARKAGDAVTRAERAEALFTAVRADCQPKSIEDCVYVSIKWRDAILEAANASHFNTILAATKNTKAPSGDTQS